MLAEYLATEWHSLDETLWREVLRLKPSHCMVAVGQGGLQLQRYWVPDLHLTLPCRTDEDYIEHYRALCADVVRRMSRANHPLALEVSGGLDSSALFAMAETLRQQGSLLAPGLEGYTLDFSGDPAADEMVYVRAVGSHLGRSIREVTPSHQPLESYRETARRYREFPDYPNGAMCQSIAEVARSGGSRVLISGTGGDEWLGGSRHYCAEAIAGWRGREMLALLQRDRREAGLPTALWWQIRHGLLPLLPGSLRRSLRKILDVAQDRRHDLCQSWLAPAMQQHLAQRRKPYEPDPLLAWERIGQRRQGSLLWHPQITLGREINERRTSGIGLEWRQPFWDVRIIQAAFATPEHLRLRGFENKWLHRRALAALLPQQVLTRHSKAEFSVAFSRYWKDLRPEFLACVLPSRSDWVEQARVIDLMDKAFDHAADEWEEGIVWTLFGLDAVAGAGHTA
jgi:asparagine synthase (glutamine-hydrolysing)